MKRHVGIVARIGLAASVLLGTGTASALPGIYVGKNEEKRSVHSTHVIVMRKADTSVVTVMPDYAGPLEPFGWLLPVPADVTEDRVKVLKRNFVDRVEQMTAPRFHEFWEMDPCEPGPPEQEWERSMAASASTNFLGGGMPGMGEKRVAKELLLTVEPEFKEKSEYQLTVLTEEQSKDAAGWLKQQGYVVTEQMAQAIKPYADSGMKFVFAAVDSNAIELIGGNRGVLSPIRFATNTAFDKLPIRMSLPSLDKAQELFVYVLHPDQRYEVKNYKNLVPPTNLEVDFKVKERMGEFYTALHDLMLKKNPNTFLSEYAWSTEGCGRPCPNEPLLINEILSLGGDFFEQAVPEEERNPKPPALTEEEEKAQKAELDLLNPAERGKAKKEMEQQRKELARRKALLVRQKYVMSRLHYRYDAGGAPQDPELGPAGHLEGGLGVPRGKGADLPLEVKPASESRLQIRYNFFHPWISVNKCEKPEPHKWGKAPRTYRGLRKVWVADDLSRKSRTLFTPAAVIKDPVPSLGITPVSAPADGGTDAGSDAGTAGGGEKKGCGCTAPGHVTSGGRAWLGLLAAAALLRRLQRWARAT